MSTKREYIRKFSLKSFLGSWKFLGIELGVLTVLLVLSVLSFNSQNSSTQATQTKGTTANLTVGKLVTKVKAVNTATASAQASASHKPTSDPAPLNSGRSVRVPIIYYHYIGNNPNPADKARNALSTAPDVFDKQMGYLASNGYTPISLDTLYAALKGGSLPPKPIVLTFDDGYIDFYVNAFQILEKYHFHATSFIPTNLIGTGYYMSWNQIKEIQGSGLVSFESHSLTHPNLVALPPAVAKNQIFESKKILESEIGVPVNFFAYPFGTSNSLDWGYAKEAGYFGAVGTWYGKVESEGNQFDWPRVRIGGGISMDQFVSDVQ